MIDAKSSEYMATANARFRTPTLVAKTFIPPEQFRRLAQASHTVMVGPRGSGKTTLLKMLTPEALEEAAQSKRFRLEAGVTFTGVFIPSDIAWSKQLEMFSRWNLPGDVSRSIYEASFTSSVLRNFAGALRDRFTRTVPATWLNIAHVEIDAALEARMAEALAGIWGLELRVPSLLGLRAAAAERIVDLGRMAAQLHRDPTRMLDEDLLVGPLVPQLTLALDTIEALVPKVAGEKWCLLFDELELAPPETMKSLISSMRSVDERLIFKLAIAPYSADLSELVSAVAAMPGHDHEEIWLSYGHKLDAMQFSFELMRAIVRDRFGQSVSLEALLGDAIFPSDDDTPAQSDDLTPAQEDYVRELYGIDGSFKKYVERVSGSLDELLASKGQLRSQNLRKVIPLVIVRVAFRNPDNSDAARSARKFRTRKNPHIYSGTTALAAIMEGNPRWIIGVMTALLQENATRVKPASQSAEIARIRNRFRAMLATIPVPAATDTRRGLLSLLDLIGESFRGSIVADDFNPDPVGTFTVDPSASDALIEALGSAVNAGAIVYVPDASGAGLLSSMRGKRFRLSYLFATKHQLPLRLERAASLRFVLSKNVADTPLELFNG